MASLRLNLHTNFLKERKIELKLFSFLSSKRCVEQALESQNGTSANSFNLAHFA